MDPLPSLVTALAAGAAAALHSTVEHKISPFHRKSLRPALCWHHGICYKPSPDPLMKWALIPRVSPA